MLPEIEKMIDQSCLPPRKKVLSKVVCEADICLQAIVAWFWDAGGREGTATFLKWYLDHRGLWPLIGQRPKAPIPYTPMADGDIAGLLSEMFLHSKLKKLMLLRKIDRSGEDSHGHSTVSVH